MDYTHKDNHTYLPRDIIETSKFVFVILIVVGLFVFCTFYAKDYIGEMISGIFGLLAGGGLGYTYGFKKKGQQND
jgi:hypothetical protein